MRILHKICEITFPPHQQHWLPLQLPGRAGAIPNELMDKVPTLSSGPSGTIWHGLSSCCKPAWGAGRNATNQLSWCIILNCVKDTFSLPEPLSPGLHPQLHGACAPVTWPKGQNARKTGWIHINIYIWTYVYVVHIHKSFQQPRKHKPQNADPLLSPRGVLLTWKLELPVPEQK